MAFKALIFGHRIPSISPEEFKHHYEAHMSVIQEMAGPHFPLSHTRRYIERPDGENARVIVGSQADFDYDVLAEMVFESEEVYQAFYKVLTREENAKWIEEDEKKFFDRTRVRIVVLGDTEVTERKV
ncbi:EthD domain-containing protein [Hypoxylon sp. NC0597]|nr:EthD domain-containing protein [Hypoxylon sp. NC0597]